MNEATKVKNCPRVKPHTTEYLHYLTQCCRSPTKLQDTYNRPSNITSAVHYPSMFPIDIDAHRVGLSEENTGFQPQQEQDVADQCVHVPDCDRTVRYRSLNGSCNNLIFPMWGVAGSALVRLLPANYQDGVSKVRKTKSGKELPNVRQLRTLLFPDKNVPDSVNMLNVMQWGQLVAHDTSHIVQQSSGLPSSTETGLDCCVGRSQNLPSSCLPIQVPNNDPFYCQYKRTCLNFVRSLTTDDLGCKLSPHQQIASVTHFVDASFVYGSDEDTARSLRTFTHGKLMVQVTPDNREFPPNSTMPERDCDSQREGVCYLTGDDRGNQNTGMTVLQVLLLREHNRLCDQLYHLNPMWDDQILYEEARRILVAVVQRITYNDYLPIILGKEFIKQLGVEDGQGDEKMSFNDYDPFLNPSTVNAFTTAAYRSFHSMIPREMVLFDDNQQPLKTLLLDDFFFRPSLIQEPGMFDNLLRGLAVQNAQSMDIFFSTSITNLLFKSTREFGTDLESIDMQRGRDHGLPVYNEFRVACGRPKAVRFKDLLDVMPEQAVSRLSAKYQRVNDVDLYVGGMLETQAPGALVGPTFQCIIGEQFRRWRNGDRFYYEFANQPGSFTFDQVKEIRKVTLAEVFCQNGDNITRIQPDVFRVISNETGNLWMRDYQHLTGTTSPTYNENIYNTYHSLLARVSQLPYSVTGLDTSRCMITNTSLEQHLAFTSLTGHCWQECHNFHIL
ncbi:peroxidase-like isoform X2 [Homalodisca vitripennis]|nr:peroxidase-like isoform X2 [Homalodisca vitripennis]